MADIAIDESTSSGHRPRRTTAWDAVRCIFIALAILVVCAGDSVSGAAEELPDGIRKEILTAVGKPTGAIADALPFAAATDQVTGWFSPDDDTAGGGDEAVAVAAGSGASRVPPQAFAPQALGEEAPPRQLKTLLITGDSMSQPLDAQLARELADEGVRTIRDPHLGTGISKPFLLDWPKQAALQAREEAPDAVVVFLGANEGFPLETKQGEIECCGPEWAAEYATKARSMMESYRRGGKTQVYWITLPAPRSAERAKVARTVNAAIKVAAGAFGAQVDVVDAAEFFSPGGKFRASLEVGGREQVVRNADGIHLNDEGAKLLADGLQRDLRAAFPPAAG